MLLFVKISKRIGGVGAEMWLERALDDLAEISRQVPSLEHIGL